MKKRFVAFLLVLIMVLGMLPVSALAADDGVSPQALNTGHKIDVTFTVLYVGNEFNIGYNYGTSEKTQFVCQYSTPHSDTAYNNHTIAISDIKAAADRATVNSGYQIVGWSKEANANPKTWGFDLKDPTACNKGTTIYLVAKNPNPNPTYMYYLYYKYNDGTNSTWLTEVTDRPTEATTFTFYVNGAKLKDRRGYEHIGWADKADAAAAKYTGGEPITLTKDDPAKTIYAVWMPFFELKYDANGGTGAPDSQTRTASHPTVNQVTFTVRDQIPTKEGCTFKGWADSATATDAQYQPGGKVTVKHADSPKTVYAVWEESAPQPPLIPVPSYDDLKSAIGKIQVKDVSTPSCGTENYDLIDNTQSDPFNWTKTARLDQPGKYDVTIKTAPYVAKYNSEKTKTHELNNANQTTLKLVISYENNKWVLDDGLRVIEVKHNEQTPPVDKPNPPTQNDLLGLTIAKVYCAASANHGAKDFTYIRNTLDTSRTYTVNENGFCTVYLSVAPYVTAYNGYYTSSSHARRAEDPATVPVTLVYRTDHWEVAREGDKEALADIPVYCAETPVEPAKPTALDGSFAIVCKNNEATHAHKADYIATPSQYTISDVQTDEQGYYVTATVTVAPNLVAYNTLTGAEHRLVNEQDATLTITFRYDTEVTVDENRKWEQQGEVPVVEVICKPKAPTADDLKKLEMAVQVKCVVDDSQQHTAAYDLLGEYDEDYFVGEPRKDGDDWLCDINYYPERYVAEFNTTFQNLKHVQNDEKIVPVTLIWAGDSWQIKEQGRVHVTEVYTVTYTDGVENEEVFADQVYSDLRKDSTTPAFNGTPTRTGYTFAGWEPKVAETVTQTVIYVAMWTPVEPKAPTADELKELDMAVLVKCVVDNSQQHTEAYGLLGECDEDYFVGEPRKDGDDWLCDISYYPERYVAEFNTTFQNLKHVQNDEKIVPVTLIWAGGSWQIKEQGRVPVTEVYTVTYTDGVENEEVFADQVYSDLRKDSATPAFNGTPTRTGYTFAGWEPEVAATVTQTVTYVAKWEKKTYKVVAKLYVNGKPAYYQNEDFYTYKVSGLYGENIDFDTIKAEAVEQAKQIKKASASYTAVILEDHEPNPVCTTFGEHQPGQATHYVKVNVKTEENVVIFQSFEGKTDLTKLHTTTAPYGTNVVEFLNGLGLDLDVAGYTLDTAEDGNTNWYKKDSPKWTFGANDTINGWTNVLLKYTITPHNIYAFARLNSAFAPLTSVEFGEFVKLNDATLTRLGLGSYNANNYISIGTFSFNKLPLMGDDFMSYYGDEEFDAVVAELADNIVLETGVSKEVAEKIAWTYLFKADNSDYMTEAGYPTDDENGYQLSGNLNLATVMFEANGENVTGMPAVNYTYDDILEIHDFYFTGDTFTLPADPTREGYIFEGWSVTVIPAENDADHLDADGEDDAADETLLKAGDTYTITAGGVKFTAQWKKKTFTVKYYLPDETGAWVEKKMDTVDSVDYATYSLWTPNAEDGYEFSGWYQKTADIGVKAKVEKLYMAKEWKLYGKFTPIEYTIQYVYNDGKATSTNPTTYTVESDTITLADATGADWGKTFLEWHDENGQKITEIPTGSTGDRVITAYWNWPVHLHYLDKDNNEIESATLYVSELEPGACVLPTGEKTGYDFDGWYEAKKDIGTASHKLNALSIAKKWELYGRYTAKTDVSYTVKYLREGDNKVLAPEKVVTDQTFDTEVTEQAADVVGYTPDAPSKTMILDEYNKVLTFSYSANTYRYEIHYFLQEPDGSYMEKEVDTTPTGVFDTTVTITPDPNRYGAHYSYNSVKSVVSGVVTVDDPATILKLNVYYDLDFHTLTFDTMGGSTIAPVKVRHGLTVAKPTDPTKDKYTFIGWYVDPEFTEEYDFATVLEADKTIYAKFELTSTPIGDIYVRYDVLHIKQLPDGSYDLANAEVEHLSAKKDTTVTAVVKDYSATHHINVNSTLSKLTDTAIRPYPGPDGKPVYTILTVYYDLDFHTLTFDTMGGSRIDPVTVRHGNAVAKPKDPVNGGYIFDGWYTDKTYRTPYNFATVLTQDTTIYAKWFLIALPGVTIKKTTPKLNTSDHFAYVQGYPDGTVKPAGNITRAETAAILFRLMDEGSRKTYYSTKSGFRDVATGSWYNTYVATLNNAGVITDSSNGYFRPNEAITRAELAAMLANFTETAGAANYFNDVSARYWAANAIAICAKLGWITGYPDGSFRPDRNVTRAELMAMINRATGRAPKSADAFLPGMKTWSDNTADKWYYLDVQEATNSHSYTVKDSEKWTALNADPNWSLYE